MRPNQANRLAWLRWALARGELVLDLEALASALIAKEPQLFGQDRPAPPQKHQRVQREGKN